MQDTSPEFQEIIPFRPNWRNRHWSVWVGYLLGTAATIGYTILAYMATLSTGIAYLPFILAGVVFFANVRIFAVGAAKALKLLCDFDDTARLFNDDLRSWNLGSTFRMLLIAAAIVLFVSAGFALGVTVYSAVVGLGMPGLFAFGLSCATFASVSLTMWLGFTILVTTPLSRYKEVFRKLFYPDEDLSTGSRKAWIAYVFKLAVVMSFITLGITLGVLAAIAPLSMMHAAGVHFLSQFALVKTSVLANSFCNLVVYGFAGAIRIGFSAIAVGGFTGRWGIRLLRLFTHPAESYQSFEKWAGSRFKDVKSFFKNFIWEDVLGFVKDGVDSVSGLLFYVPSNLYWVAPAASISAAMTGFGELEGLYAAKEMESDDEIPLLGDELANPDEEHGSDGVLNAPVQSIPDPASKTDTMDPAQSDDDPSAQPD